MARHPVVEKDLSQLVDALWSELRVLEGRTVLLSGGAGFLGSYIAATIEVLNRRFRNPCRVLVLDSLITGSRQPLIGPVSDPNIEFIEHDVRQPLHVDGPVDYALHAAGIASPAYYRKFPLETIETAVWGTKNFLELCRAKRVYSFLFFSSSEIYGDPDAGHVPTAETYKGNVSSTGPRACYDESKRLSETLCTVYHALYKSPVKMVRPFNVFGPGMNSKDLRVIPSFLMNALKGMPIVVYGTGEQTRTFCYVTDALAGFFKALLSEQQGEVYNVGNDENEIPMIRLAGMVQQLTKSRASPQLHDYPVSYPADEPMRRCPDLTKIRTQLNYAPTISLEDGLHRTLEWFRDAYRAELSEQPARR